MRDWHVGCAVPCDMGDAQRFAYATSGPRQQRLQPAPRVFGRRTCFTSSRGTRSIGCSEAVARVSVDASHRRRVGPGSLEQPAVAWACRAGATAT